MDRIEIFGERLKKCADGIRAMKTFGLDEEILIAWLRVKLKISHKEAQSIIKCEQEFFDKLMKEELLKELKNAE